MKPTGRLRFSRFTQATEPIKLPVETRDSQLPSTACVGCGHSNWVVPKSSKRNLMDLARQLPELRFNLVDANVDQETLLELASINRVASEWEEVPIHSLMPSK